LVANGQATCFCCVAIRRRRSSVLRRLTVWIRHLLLVVVFTEAALALGLGQTSRVFALVPVEGLTLTIRARLAQRSQLRQEELVGRLVRVLERVDLRHELVVHLRTVIEELLAAGFARIHLRRVYLRTTGHESPWQRSGGHFYHQIEPALNVVAPTQVLASVRFQTAVPTCAAPANLFPLRDHVALFVHVLPCQAEVEHVDDAVLGVLNESRCEVARLHVAGDIADPMELLDRFHSLDGDAVGGRARELAVHLLVAHLVQVLKQQSHHDEGVLGRLRAVVDGLDEVLAVGLARRSHDLDLDGQHRSVVLLDLDRHHVVVLVLAHEDDAVAAVAQLQAQSVGGGRGVDHVVRTGQIRVWNTRSHCRGESFAH
ncbi:hypothetical protein PENTCL1PPCAC_21743, partial [Pristionchus entomophagus]